MLEVLQQLLGLFIQAIPTVIIVFLFYVMLRILLFGPLGRVMDERAARTEGARKEAEASQAAAREKVRAYEEALRKARLAVYAEQDIERRTLLDQRAAHAREARAAAMARVQAEKTQIAQDATVARAQLEAGTPQLAAEMVRRLLEAPSGGSGPRPAASEAR
jgi:F-type H+-transporting ATPase subunit b